MNEISVVGGTGNGPVIDLNELKQWIGQTPDALPEYLTPTALSATYGPDAQAASGKVIATQTARINDVGATAALMQNLDAGAASCAIQIIGDSTGVGATRWPYLMAQYLASQYPAFTVKHRAWNDTAQMYDAPTLIQTGAGGSEERHARLASGNNVWLYQPQSTSTDITGDLDVSRATSRGYCN